MSEHQEQEINKGFDPMAFLPGQEKPEGFKERVSHNVDSQSYFLGEVPQGHLVDPAAFLPLNSDRLLGAINMVEKLLFEIGHLIEEEVTLIQKQQKRIAFWEDRIEKNRACMKKNELRIKQNITDISFDKKNRDYWYNRAEDVETDYSHAEISARAQDWAWLVKKYGLKNADGSEIDSKGSCVEELCNGETRNLAAEYRNTGHKYETAKKDKESENAKLIRENSQFARTNEVLQGYISAAYSNEIEPLQDGVLLMKELGLKIKTLGQHEHATYGELRAWAEPFLDQFIRTNHRVPQDVVTHFRKLTSIPLPPEYC